MNKMRILQVIPQLSSGGAEKFVVDLLTNFDNTTSETMLLVLYPRINSFFERVLDEKHVKVIYLNKKKGFDVALILAVRKIIKDFKPDVIHTHLYALAYVATASRWMSHKPLIVHTVHNLAEKETTSKKQKLYEHFFHHWQVHPIGISQQITISIENRYKLKDVDTIYNGIDYLAFKGHFSMSSRTHDFIHVGRFDYQKNHALLISAMQEVVERRPASKLYLVGEGPLMDECQKQINDAGLQKNIILLGFCEDVASLLRDSKIFVLPSRYEGNPLSMLEAMAAGCAVLATPVGGVPDILEDGVNGYLVEENAGDLAAHMLSLIDDESAMIRISHANMIKIEKYDMKIVCENYMMLYKKYLKL